MMVQVIDTEPPVASAGLDRMVSQGTPVDLFGGASSDNVGISEYLWWFDYLGENRTIRGCVAVFTFDVPRTYWVHLNVMDGSGNMGHDMFELRVTDAEPPNAIAGKDIMMNQNETIHLDGSDSTDNVGIVDYAWSILGPDTDMVLHGCNVSFSLAIPGIYTATLKVEDAERNKNTSVLDIVVVKIGDVDGNATDTAADAPIAPPYLIIGSVAFVIIVVIVLIARRRPRSSVRTMDEDAPSG